MSVAQRSDGRYVVKFKDETGRWRQRSFHSEDEARQFDGDCQYDDKENERLTVLEAVMVYLKNNKLSLSSIEAFEYAVKGYNRRDGKHTEGPAECLASRYVDTLTSRDLETVYENCRARKMKASSTNRIVASCLKAAFNWCVQRDLIPENPWAKYKNLPSDTVHMCGTLEEFQKIYAVLPLWMQWPCRTALALCLRPGMVELFGLRWSAFEWRTGTVTVFMGKVGRAKTVYAPEDYLAEAWERYCADGQDGGKLVCRNRKDGPVTERAYAQAWQRACKLAGVRMPMYGIRGICATEMLAEGIDLAAVAAQLGHKDLTTTGRHYIHALPSAQKAAARALPSCASLVPLGAASKEKPKQ